MRRDDMYRVLITGGAGFIGSHVTEYLACRGYKVIVVDNLLRGSMKNLEHLLQNDNVDFIQADAADFEEMAPIFRRHAFDLIFHLAAHSDIQLGAKHPELDIYHTLQTTLTILDCMRRFHVTKMLFSSSSAIYGFRPGINIHEDHGPILPVSYYGSAKAAAEAFIAAYCHRNHMQSWLLRFPNVVGQRLTHGVVYDFVARLKNNSDQLTILGDGRQTKPYIHVTDLLEAMMVAWQNSNEAVNYFNIGLPSRLSVNQVADIICQEMGLSGVRYQYTGGSGGWPGDIPEFAYDLSKIENLGWQPRLSAEEAVRLSVRGNL